MNTKFVLALLFSLVSFSLCEMPTPSKELVDKYEGHKATFYSRLLNAYKKLQAKVSNTDEHEQIKAAKDALEEALTKPEVQAAVKVGSYLGQEIVLCIDQLRTALLGLYEKYARPHVGTSLDSGIQSVKPYLDSVMPAE